MEAGESLQAGGKRKTADLIGGMDSLKSNAAGLSTDGAEAEAYQFTPSRSGHVVKIDPMKVLERLLRRGADTRLSHLPKALKCGRCGGKDFTATHCQGPVISSR